MSRILVVSDGKPGHVNQSLAFASLKGSEAYTLQVRFRNRLCRLISYLLDHLRIYSPFLYDPIAVPEGGFTSVVAAGSETYYAALLLGRRLKLPVVSMMLPSGYRLAGFEFVLAQEHDQPPQRLNVVRLPINLCQVRPQGLFVPSAGKRTIGIILGGTNKTFCMEVPALQAQLEQIFKHFSDAEVVVATSRRTPDSVEGLLAGFPFKERWLYSQNPANPIPDFLAHCSHVFISCDSTSMISEAVSFGTSAVEVLPLPRRRHAHGKFDALIENLAALGCLHLFDGQVADCRKKVELTAQLEGVLA